MIRSASVLEISGEESESSLTAKIRRTMEVRPIKQRASSLLHFTPYCPLSDSTYPTGCIVETSSGMSILISVPRPARLSICK